MEQKNIDQKFICDLCEENCETVIYKEKVKKDKKKIFIE